jgi:hypothetical protein
MGVAKMTPEDPGKEVGKRACVGPGWRREGDGRLAEIALVNLEARWMTSGMSDRGPCTDGECRVDRRTPKNGIRGGEVSRAVNEWIE